MLIVLAAAASFSRILSLLQASTVVENLLGPLLSHKVILLLIINLVLLVLGMIIDTSPNILIFTPVMLPLAEAVGVDAVLFGIIMVVNLAIGFVSPPVGVNLYVAQSISSVPVLKLAQKAAPYIVMFIVALLLITFVPQLSTLLVELSK